jgi:hypothetical protein
MLQLREILSFFMLSDFVRVAANVGRCRSLGIWCRVRPLMLLIKGTKFSHDYKANQYSTSR